MPFKNYNINNLRKIYNQKTADLNYKSFNYTDFFHKNFNYISKVKAPSESLISGLNSKNILYITPETARNIIETTKKTTPDTKLQSLLNNLQKISEENLTEILPILEGCFTKTNELQCGGAAKYLTDKIKNEEEILRGLDQYQLKDTNIQKEIDNYKNKLTSRILYFKKSLSSINLPEELSLANSLNLDLTTLSGQNNLAAEMIVKTHGKSAISTLNNFEKIFYMNHESTKNTLETTKKTTSDAELTTAMKDVKVVDEDFFQVPQILLECFKKADKLQCDIATKRLNDRIKKDKAIFKTFDEYQLKDTNLQKEIDGYKNKITNEKLIFKDLLTKIDLIIRTEKPILNDLNLDFTALIGQNNLAVEMM